MGNPINYILESGISLSFMAMVYVIFLRKETFFRLNRMFLLGSILFSVVLPFLRFRVYDPRPVMLPEVTVTPYRNVLEVITVYGHDLSVTVEQALLSADLLIWLYLAGVAFFLGRFLVRMFGIVLLIRRHPVHKQDRFRMVFLDQSGSPYSFLSYIFVNRSLQGSEDFHRMVAHEMEHVRQGHSLDVLLLEVLTSFQWFNPFMWMLRRVIRENHEFLADRAVLNSGVSPGYYKKLLLSQFAGGQLLLTNHFSYSIIKKRIKMMTKIKSSRVSNVKVALGIIIAFALIVVFACEQKEAIDMPKTPGEQSLTVTMLEQDQNALFRFEGSDEALLRIRNIFMNSQEFALRHDSLGNLLLQKKVKEKFVTNNGRKVFFIVEEMPEFPGGEPALRTFLTQNIHYPDIASKHGIQGKVYVTFIVSDEGDVVNARIARGVDPVLDQEALRVVNSLPRWKPGYMRGKPVDVSYTVPINFALE
ncbi:MAG: M56 family metallopeptidase [Mariniphaga sp.]|nr:M56 family metallopeptidase [Mariniphaga sp.]